jgi:dephospho-CoA kinase
MQAAVKSAPAPSLSLFELYLTMRQMPADPSAAVDTPRAFRPRTPVVIGILGGIAAGKSAVAERLAAHGLHRIDADAEARTVSADPAVLDEIAQAFGPAVVRAGQLDRAALAAVVFEDAAARSRLEGILHPRIRARILAELAAAAARGQSALLDAPLLLEGGLIDFCDRVLFVDAAPAVRAARAAARGWSPDELARREAAQATLPAKRARAHFTLDTSGDLAAMHREVAAVLDQLRTTFP